MPGGGHQSRASRLSPPCLAAASLLGSPIALVPIASSPIALAIGLFTRLWIYMHAVCMLAIIANRRQNQRPLMREQSYFYREDER
jgi:hypothetical protein